MAHRKQSRRQLVSRSHRRRLTGRTIVHTMDSVRYEWDPTKADANVRVHGVTFAEASTVFSDDLALTREDSDAPGEHRYITLGRSDTGALLVVVYTDREPDTLRVISAWKADRRQRLLYEERRR